MPNLAQLGLWGQSGQMYGPGQTYSDPAAAQSALAAALQYDPNARLGTVSTFNGNDPSTEQQLIMDPSKLPQAQTPGLVPYIGTGWGGNGPSTLANPNLVRNDPNWGPMTIPQNIRSRNDSTWLDTVGPLLVGGAIGLGGGFSMLGSLLSKLPNVAQMASGMLQRPTVSAMTPQQQYGLYSIMRGY